MPDWTRWITSLILIIFLQPIMISPQHDASDELDFNSDPPINVTCSELRMGQYLCNMTHIDPSTQQPYGCSRDTWTAKSNYNTWTLLTTKSRYLVPCKAVKGLRCKETGTREFEKEVPCKWTNGYKLDTALLLSVFLGVVGADRFYLGHLGMGALKFCTLGFLFIGQFVDIILLATQQIGPKDNSSFIVGYYGPGVSSIRANNMTYIVPRPDWF